PPRKSPKKKKTTKGQKTENLVDLVGDIIARRTERFKKLDKSRFWKLNSGRTVEDVLFNASLSIHASV
ncbi:hypothetical protein BGZ76_007919, partial [Entomortierella beljakovae]